MKSIRLKEATEVSRNGIGVELLEAGVHEVDDALAAILVARGKATDVLMVEVEEKAKPGRPAKD